MEAVALAEAAARMMGPSLDLRLWRRAGSLLQGCSSQFLMQMMQEALEEG